MYEVLKILFKEEYEEAYKEAYKEAYEEARAEGRMEVRKSFAREMLLDGKPDAEILRYSRLSEVELNVLKGECLKDGLK